MTKHLSTRLTFFLDKQFGEFQFSALVILYSIVNRPTHNLNWNCWNLLKANIQRRKLL